jgi:hypothetical protein
VARRLRHRLVLQTNAVAQTTDTPLTVTLASSSAAGSFATSVNGPWTSTLDFTVRAGASSASFYCRDTKQPHFFAPLSGEDVRRLVGSVAERHTPEPR